MKDRAKRPAPAILWEGFLDLDVFFAATECDGYSPVAGNAVGDGARIRIISKAGTAWERHTSKLVDEQQIVIEQRGRDEFGAEVWKPVDMRQDSRCVEYFLKGCAEEEDDEETELTGSRFLGVNDVSPLTGDWVACILAGFLALLRAKEPQP